MTDIDNLQGNWNVVSLELEGAAMTAGSFAGARIVIDGDRFTTIAMGAEYAGVMSVDGGQNPKAFNLQFTSGPEAGNVSYGIYELAGNVWRICLTTTGKKRPNAFATAPGSGLALETLRRGPVPAVQRKTIEGEAVAELDGEWKMKSCVRDGIKLESTMVKNGKRVARAGETTISFGGQVFIRANFRVDTSATPKTIEYFNIEGQHEQATQLGIYEFVGQTLRFCFGAVGQDRPREFSSAKGSGRTLAEWVRT